ncbi:MAG: helix-turn-helix domain-containing protein [Planctomycetaceae bacterium]|jgi:DNA-binding NarL/FixJ family response regulator|nr:helix-turn-helix domain-containing protein [Planctomycetaceae bacterium]
MLRANYTEEEQQTFRRLHYHHPDPKIRQRFEILLLHSCGESIAETAILAGCNEKTVRHYIHLYASKGFNGITAVDHTKPESELG